MVRRCVTIVLVAGLGSLPGYAQAPSTALVDVAVVPMDRERVLEGQTVLVRGDRIIELGPANRIRVPAGVTKIDGRGKFLMPGLAGMPAAP